jgi:hypothetical protein
MTLEFHLDQAAIILSRTPDVLNALLRDAPREWTMADNGDGSWSPWAVVGHLLNGEENEWIARARIILEYGESREFDPFDREAMFTQYVGIPLPELLDRFATARLINLDDLRSFGLAPHHLALKGKHPTLGAVTLSQLLSTWVVHDFNHIGQIVEVMSRHYKDAVGPWVEFLPILTRGE